MRKNETETARQRRNRQGDEIDEEENIKVGITDRKLSNIRLYSLVHIVVCFLKAYRY